MKIVASLNGAQYTQTDEYLFDVTLNDGCLGQVITIPTQTTHHTNDYQSATAFTFADFTNSIPACSVTYSCAMVAGPSTDLCNYSDAYTTSSLDPSTRLFSFTSTDYFTYGSQTITFEITGSSAGSSESFQFSIDLQSPCESATVLKTP